MNLTIGRGAFVGDRRALGCGQDDPAPRDGWPGPEDARSRESRTPRRHVRSGASRGLGAATGNGRLELPGDRSRSRAYGALVQPLLATMDERRPTTSSWTSSWSDLASAAWANRHIRSLSGGQQQRVFLARAMVGGPDTAASRRTDQRRGHQDARRHPASARGPEPRRHDDRADHSRAQLGRRAPSVGRVRQSPRHCRG